ncbi:hypothetical protein JCGZ_13141 [Jatropha curcas]|uniref:Uncharacterized protein n=1 Tax=Jatropha curcas TaxID=180498 RepID=A0A067K8M9_JATCU|nr:hypothetical protein JCGZ_13141 [Jatropha curcas]
MEEEAGVDRRRIELETRRDFRPRARWFSAATGYAGTEERQGTGTTAARRLVRPRGSHGSGIAGFDSRSEPKINSFSYGLEPNGFSSSMVPKSAVSANSPAYFLMIQAGFRPVLADFGRFQPISDGTKTIDFDWNWNRRFTVPKLVKPELNRFRLVPVSVFTGFSPVPTGLEPMILVSKTGFGHP